MTHRYRKWTDYEDHILDDLVQKQGTKNWAQIAQKMQVVYQITKRSGKQCRQRWLNHLAKSINSKKWSVEDDRNILHYHSIHGNRWMDIARHFKGRSDNHTKNHFYSVIRKSLRRMCKSIEMKKSELNIYSIKPCTLSRVFYVGGQESIKKDNKGQMDKDEVIAEYCREITHIIMTFIFAKKGEILTLAGQKKEKIKWALFKIIQMNQLYQKDAFPSYILSNSQMQIQVQKRDKLGEQLNMENEIKTITASLKEIDQQNKEFNQQDNEGGIFNQRYKQIQKRPEQTTLSQIQSANLLQRIKPISQSLSKNNTQFLSLSIIQFSSKLILPEPLPSFTVGDLIQDENQLYFHTHMIEYKTPKRSWGDIFNSYLQND